MQIVIQPPEDGYGLDSYVLKKTQDVLRAATIQIEGLAVVTVRGTRRGVLTLRAKADTRRALEALKLAGLRVSQ